MPMVFMAVLVAFYASFIIGWAGNSSVYLLFLREFVRALVAVL
jgi:hypothetical protein